MAIYGGRSLTFGGKEQPEAVLAIAVSPEFFSVLRVRPVLGRTFTPEESRPGGERVILLGYQFWRDHFGSDASIVGGDVTINSHSYVVAGVMPGSFRFSLFSNIRVPLPFPDPPPSLPSNHNFPVIPLPHH